MRSRAVALVSLTSAADAAALARWVGNAAGKASPLRTPSRGSRDSREPGREGCAACVEVPIIDAVEIGAVVAAPLVATFTRGAPVTRFGDKEEARSSSDR